MDQLDRSAGGAVYGRTIRPPPDYGDYPTRREYSPYADTTHAMLILAYRLVDCMPANVAPSLVLSSRPGQSNSRLLH